MKTSEVIDIRTLTNGKFDLENLTEDEWNKIKKEIEGYDHCITTKDNPFDPITDFRRWWIYDESFGYNTCSLLAKYAHTSDEMSDFLNDLFTFYGYLRILKWDAQNIYQVVRAPSKTKV